MIPIAVLGAYAQSTDNLHIYYIANDTIRPRSFNACLTVR